MVKRETGLRTVNVKEDLWRELTQEKLNKNKTSLSELIEFLLLRNKKIERARERLYEKES